MRIDKPSQPCVSVCASVCVSIPTKLKAKLHDWKPVLQSPQGRWEKNVKARLGYYEISWKLTILLLSLSPCERRIPFVKTHECDLQAGTIKMAEKQEWKRSRAVHTLWRWRKWREGSEEEADMSGLCFHLRPWWYPARTAAKGHVGVPAPAAAGLCIDVHGPCYHWGPCEPQVLKSEGHAELAPPFAGSGRSGPATLWLLQLERWTHHSPQGIGELPLMVWVPESWLNPLPQAGGPNRGWN